MLKRLARRSGLITVLRYAASLLIARDRYREAEAYLLLWLRFDPQSIDCQLKLALCKQCRNQPKAALPYLQAVLQQVPELTEARVRLGEAAQAAEQWALASAHFEWLCQRFPQSAEYRFHLGNACLGAGDLQVAIAHFEAALALEEVASTHNGLALAWSELGQLNKAVQHFRRAAELSSKPLYQSNLLFTLCYSDALTPQQLYAEHLAYAARFAAEERVFPRRTFDAQRPLRIGYLSPDLHFHPVSFFLEPVLRQHDGQQFMVHAYYSQAHRRDAVTDRLRALCPYWREFEDPEDPELAQAIVRDQIDVLIDLAGHTANNSLPLLAQRLAPLQMTWLGYLNTSGLPTIDYRISDAIACPPEFAQPLHREQLAFLPASQWCYQPPAQAPAVTAAPCLRNGYLTFGALHNPSKIGPQVLALWVQLLQNVADSRLLIAAQGFYRLANETRQFFASHGIAPERIDIRDRMAFADYLALHGEIDINLDAFPYNGGTTTCHSLWMGVPVLSLAVERVTGRGGASLLKALGLDDWVTDTDADYIKRAEQAATEFDQLSHLRAGLREKMAASPLCEALAFTRALETIYRSRWQLRCQADQSTEINR